MHSWQRVFFLPLAALVTAGLFLAMVGMINRGASPPLTIPDIPSFTFITPESPTIEEPPPVKPPPEEPQKISERPATPATTTPTITDPNRDPVAPPSRISQPTTLNLVPPTGIGELGAGQNAGLTAKVQMRPLYPIRPRANGVEGFVEVAFTVDTMGLVVDVEVIKSRPGNVFVQSVLRAVYRWRFEPAIVDGIAVETRVKKRFEFKLSDQ